MFSLFSVCMCVCMGTHVQQHVYEGQSSLVEPVLSSAFTWVLGTELRLSPVRCKCLFPLRVLPVWPLLIYNRLGFI